MWIFNTSFFLLRRFQVFEKSKHTFFLTGHPNFQLLLFLNLLSLIKAEVCANSTQEAHDAGGEYSVEDGRKRTWIFLYKFSLSV